MKCVLNFFRGFKQTDVVVINNAVLSALLSALSRDKTNPVISQQVRIFFESTHQYIHMNTNIHTYIHLCMHTYIHTYHHRI